MVVLGKIFCPITVACLTLLFSPLVADSQDEAIPTDEEDAQSLLVRVANTDTDLEQFYSEALEVTETLSKGWHPLEINFRYPFTSTPAQCSSNLTAEQKSSSAWPRAMLAPKS